MNSNQLQLNRTAQGLASIDSTVQWFDALAKPEREAALVDLAHICYQAHPRTEEIAPAIARSGLKPTVTPCVLLQKATRPEQSLQRIISLPEAEHNKAFRLLLALFCVADERRRATQCREGCTHEWHKLRA